MPKGRTSAPLKIVVDLQWAEHPAVKALTAAGHDVQALLLPADLILHPAAHNWIEEDFQEQTKKDGSTHRPYLEAAIAAARARKRRK